MPKIVIENLNKKEILSQNDKKLLLDIIHENNVDWMYACGGKGRCTTCKAIFLKGIENVSPITACEDKYMDSGRLKKNERLTCQCHILGDVVIKVDSSNKFMHLSYSD